MTDALNILYQQYDGPIPSKIYEIVKTGGYRQYTHKMALAAERQFERITTETQQNIRHYRMVNEPVFSTVTLDHLSKQLLHHRNRAIQARDLRQKSAL